MRIALPLFYARSYSVRRSLNQFQSMNCLLIMSRLSRPLGSLTADVLVFYVLCIFKTIITGTCIKIPNPDLCNLCATQCKILCIQIVPWGTLESMKGTSFDKIFDSPRKEWFPRGRVLAFLISCLRVHFFSLFLLSFPSIPSFLFPQCFFSQPFFSPLHNCLIVLSCYGFNHHSQNSFRSFLWYRNQFIIEFMVETIQTKVFYFSSDIE